MTEENPDLTFPANLTSMYDKEFFELVWENGQLLKRDLPRRGQNSPSCNGYSSNARVHVKKGGETFPSKTSRLGTRDSILGDSYHKNSYLNSLQDDNLHESWPELYQNHLNVLLEHGKGCINDKFQKDSQVVPVHEHANLKTSCSSNYIAEAPQLAPTSQPDQSSLKQYHESAPLKRLSVNSRKDLVSVSELADSKLQEKDLEADRKRDVANFSLFLRSPPLLKVKDLEADRKRDVANFSLFLRSPPLLKVNNQQSGVKVPASYPVGLPRAEELKNGGEKSSPVSTNHFNSLQPIITAHGSKPYQHNSTEAIVELLKPSAKPPFKIFQDEHSEADCHDDAFANNGSNNEVYSQTSNLEANKAKAKLITQKSKELAVPTSSLCSRRASNNPTYTLKRRYEDSEGSADHPTQNIEKKPKRTKAVPGSKENRKRRIAEIHNLSERRRRDKINKKMRALRELIPNCNKVDKTSMLDDAIEYLKALQLQVQMMSMGSRAYMPQMMLPTGIQEISIHVPHVSHFSPMPMRMQMGMGCNPANLLIPPNPGASIVPGPGMPMFPAQLLPTSVLHAAPLGLGLGLSNRAHQIPGVSLISATMELVDPATRSNSRNNTNAE